LSGTQITTAGLDARRRRIHFRAWHRGMREMDLILGQFSDARIADLSEAELDEFETLMEEPDRDIFMWLTGEAETPREFDTSLLARIKAMHTHAGPVNL
jgi:antitoxin CptB